MSASGTNNHRGSASGTKDARGVSMRNSGNGLRLPHKAPLSGKVQRFWVPSIYGDPVPLLYLPPDTNITPFVGARHPRPNQGFRKYEVPYGTLPGLQKFGGDSGTRRIHYDGFRDKGNFYRRITFGGELPEKRTKATTRYMQPTLIYKREGVFGNYVFRDLTPYNLVPEGSSFFGPFAQIWHQTPGRDDITFQTNGVNMIPNEERGVELLGASLPRNVIHKQLGHYVPRWTGGQNSDSDSNNGSKSNNGSDSNNGATSKKRKSNKKSQKGKKRKKSNKSALGYIATVQRPPSPRPSRKREAETSRHSP